MAWILPLLLALLPLAYGRQGEHVGESAKKRRDEVVQEAGSGVVKHAYDAGKAKYAHLPVLTFHHGGAMDLASLRIVGVGSRGYGELDPFGTIAMWVEDEKGTPVYVLDDGTSGGFAVAAHLKLPGVRLTPFQLDRDGLWIGQSVEVPESVPAPKMEL